MSRAHGCAGAATYGIAVGPQQGRKVFTLQTLPDERDADGTLATGNVAGLLRASCPPPFGPACSANSAEFSCFTSCCGPQRVRQGIGWSENGRWQENGQKRAGFQGAVPLFGEDSGAALGVKNGINCVPMVLGVMQKGVYLSYTHSAICFASNPYASHSRYISPRDRNRRFARSCSTNWSPKTSDNNPSPRRRQTSICHKRSRAALKPCTKKSS